MKTQKLFSLLLLVFSCTAFSASNLNPALEGMLTGKKNPAPAVMEKNSYIAWSAPLLQSNNAVSAFMENVFDWYSAEKDRALPSQVYQDRNKIFVRVDRPLQETIDLENQGEIEVATTIGAEVYAEMDGTPSQVLEAMLFRWGKPVGQIEGSTTPPPSPYTKRVEYFALNAEWGAGSYVNQSIRQNGGMVNDLNDRYMVLVRGNAQNGYDVLMQFVKAGGMTSTTKCFAISTIRPVGDGTKTAYKISTRYQGQSYKIFGSVGLGRSQIGFNPQKAREIQLDFSRMLLELKSTGSIRNAQ